MGVPKFFSWITKRYPLILEQTQQGSLPQIDYLYLDMNGIIYKCSKDESIIFKSMVISKELQEIWLSIFNYISNIVDIIQPKKLLFLGLDGVAPRAKMNNQRSRRYNSAKSYAAMEQRLKNYGETNQENFKNNCITPGTEFMFELNKRLRFFINKKIEQDPEWQKFRVIFSGGDVPGEGEHKIMDFIREGEKQKIFSEDSKHCLYGADADLIMLGMTLPIKNLCIIREEFVFNKNNKAINISSTKNNIEIVFQLIYITILKQYFELEYLPYKDHIKHQYNLQRIINDFVFLCFFIGNDFLPRCYCYDIREGFLQRLIDGFKEFLISSESYLLDVDNINLVELQRLTGILKKSQSLFISSRQQQLSGSQDFKRTDSLQLDKQKDINEGMMEAALDQPMKNEKEFLLTLKTLYANDDLAGAKKHFYKQKFNLDTETNDKDVTNIIESYLTGLSYVYQYYFQTLPSWEWYYPYYYAPLVNDLNVYLIYKNQNKIGLPKFQLSQPFEPFKQLLCILPKQSFGLLPSCLHDSIKSETSKLRAPYDYFPKEVKVDPYGGKQQHEFISILPFIDQNVITQVYDSADKSTLTDAEKLRNVHTLNELYVYDPKQQPTKVKSLYQYIEDFKVTLVVHELNFLKDSLAVVTDGIENKSTNDNQNEIDTYSFPTLKIREFDAKLESNQKQFRASNQLKLTIQSVQEEKPVKLGSIIYFGLPNQSSGKVLAICTKQQITADSKDFDFRDFIRQDDYKQRNYSPNQIWSFFIDEISSSYEKKKGVILKQAQVLYFVMINKKFIRKRSGKYIRGYENATYKIIPDCLVSTQRKYTYTKIPFVPKDITEQFQINEDVVILNKEFCGSTGRVIGYSNNNKKIKVQISEKLNRIPENIIQKTRANDFFWSLGFVARIFNCDLDTILILIDSLPIELDRNNVSAQGMPFAIDIGLNFVKRNFKQLVPTLVRLPLHSNINDISNIYRQFKRLQISTAALELIYKYYMKYPQIFQFLNQRTLRIKDERLEWRERIAVNEIWELDDPSKKGIEVYLWLIKQEEVHHPNSSINSTKISKVRINNLLTYFKSEKTKEFNQIQQFDPNHLYSSRLSKQGLLYLRNPPPNHRIGDRVICINPQQFGETAIIIGIDTSFKDLVFQVLFEKPSFGKDNLGGLVDYLWGGEYNYQDLFNIDSWTEDVQERGNQDGMGWDGAPPKFVNSDTFKNMNGNRRAEVIERQNFGTIINKLELDAELVEFIKKAAERNPGRGYNYVTKRDQRGINKLQKEEEVLLDAERDMTVSEPKVRYIEKQEVVEEKKEGVEKQKQEEKVAKPGEKTFKKHVFEDNSLNKGNNVTSNSGETNNIGTTVNSSNASHTGKKAYIEKTVTETKTEKPSKVFLKTRYVEKKEQKVQQPVTVQQTPINLQTLTVNNQTSQVKAPITAAQLDDELDRYAKQSNQETVQEPQTKQPESETTQQVKTSTDPTESIENQEKPEQKLVKQGGELNEQYDQEIFG